MAARNKKKASLAQTGQDSQGTVIEDMVMPAESVQAQIVVSNSVLVADATEDFIKNPVNLETDSRRGQL